MRSRYSQVELQGVEDFLLDVIAGRIPPCSNPHCCFEHAAIILPLIEDDKEVAESLFSLLVFISKLGSTPNFQVDSDEQAILLGIIAKVHRDMKDYDFDIDNLELFGLVFRVLKALCELEDTPHDAFMSLATIIWDAMLCVKIQTVVPQFIEFSSDGESGERYHGIGRHAVPPKASGAPFSLN